MTFDVLNKFLSAGASIAVIVGVIVAIGGVITAICGLSVATKTLKQTQGAASATLVLKLRDTIDEDRYKKITAEIQSNQSAHPLLKSRGGKFEDVDIERYIGNFEDIGYLVQEKVIDAEMAYNHFSYDVEKAWCNADVQRVVQEARKADKSITATADPLYGKIERLAKEYLAREGQSCKDIDNQ
jgi:hypothetical protein